MSNMHTIHNRTAGEMAELRSLDEIRRRQRDRHEQRKAAAAEAAKPRAPLSIAVQQVRGKHASKKAISIETLEHLDCIHNAAERLALRSPLDAGPLAKTLLGTLLRLAWVRVSGKELSNPERESIPPKLFQTGHLSKATMRRINNAMRKEADASNLLECCRALLVWLASDEPCDID